LTGDKNQVCIEAKADESFGGTVAEELGKARKRPVTRFPERLDWLTRSLLGLPSFNDDQFLVLSDSVAELPYQLFSAIAGTLLEARLQHASKAVFVVHEFRTTSTVDARMGDNAKALDGFLHLLHSANKGPVNVSFPVPGSVCQHAAARLESRGTLDNDPMEQRPHGRTYQPAKGHQAPDVRPGRFRASEGASAALGCFKRSLIFAPKVVESRCGAVV
jgi:hypothetical protein